MLSSHWLGTLVTLLPWGFLTDRIGERIVLATGLGSCGVFLIVAGRAETFWELYVLLFLAGAAGASVNSATGRAVMGWFDVSQRGLALGIRQAAVPLGGLVGAFVLPQLTVHQAYAFLGGLCLLGASVGAIVLREPVALPVEVVDVEWTLRDRRLWRLCSVSGLYVVAQMAILSFVALYLHDERALSKGRGGRGARRRPGRWRWCSGSAPAVVGRHANPHNPARPDRDRDGRLPRRRHRPPDAPLVVLVPAFVVAGSLTMAWNGVAFAAVAELAGRARSGSALGVQQTVLSLFGVVTPLAFAAVVSAGSWSLAYGLAALFPFAGWLVLRTIAGSGRGARYS